MKEKKFTKDYIIDAIVLKFGSIDKYAMKKKVARTNIYEKAKRQTAAFLSELVLDKVLTENEVKIDNSQRIGRDGNIDNRNNSIAKNNNNIGGSGKDMDVLVSGQSTVHIHSAEEREKICQSCEVRKTLDAKVLLLKEFIESKNEQIKQLQLIIEMKDEKINGTKMGGAKVK